jgi:hypothetical protein
MEFLNDLEPPDKHPKRRTRFMGLFGKMVNTIDHCKVYFHVVNDELPAQDWTTGAHCGNVSELSPGIPRYSLISLSVY